jgi:hypothetical protein
MPAGLQVFAGNPGAGWMPLLVALAAERKQTATLSLPLNPWLHLQLQLA